MKRWSIRETDQTAADRISEETGLCGLVSHVLACRGIKTAEQAKKFIYGVEISDPFLISDMDKAVSIIKDSLYKGEKIVIFGDYDCDGITSVVMLYQYFSALGGEVEWYIPHREEGYGLNFEAIEKLSENGVDLIITVDNGISAVKEAAFIKEKNIKLIITDHHTPPEALPEADALINPKREGDVSPFKDLAGCGVVLKLIMALEGDIESVLDQFADLAALGSIADVVPLVGENRIIVKRGIEIMPFTENIGLYKLLKQNGLLEDDGKLTANSLAFTVCPRINAAGRIAHAEKAVELLLCESEEYAELKAAELSEINNARRSLEDEIINQTDIIFSENPSLLKQRVIVVKGKDWHHGITGIVGSRLLTKWGKPCMVISEGEHFSRGSARSISEFPLVPLLEDSAGCLVKFGGHTKAAGFTVKTETIDVFLEKIKNYSESNFSEMPQDIVYIDKIINASDLTVENINQLKILRPFGEENALPLFLLKDCVIVSKKPLKDGKFLSLNVSIGGVNQKVLHFNCRYDDFWYDIGCKVDILATLNVDEYNGRFNISAYLKDIRSSGFNQDKYFAAANIYEKLARGETVEERILERAVPEKEDIKVIYDLLRGKGGILNIEQLYFLAYEKGINYCKFRIILDVLDEFKLIKNDIVNSIVELLPPNGKADLSTSVVLGKIKACVQTHC